MNSSFSLIFWRDRWVRFCTIFACLFHAAIWVLIIVKLLPISRELEFLSLHYNIFFGVDLVGQWYKIFLIPVVGLVFLILNLFLIIFFYKKEKFLARFLAGCNPLIELGLLASITLIILLNI